MDSANIIKYALSTEKAIRMMESDNKLIFVVDLKARKNEIKKAIEDLYKVKIVKVNTLIDRDGRKRAIIKFAQDNPAIDVATKLGLI